jgi:dipeptidyl-peptidase-4
MSRFFLTSLLFMITAGGVLTGQELTNEKIWYSSEFRMDYVSGVRSMNDGLHYTSMEYSDANGSEIVKFNYASGERVEVIASSLSIFGDAKQTIEGYTFSDDELKLLIETEGESIYRHSSQANYYVFDLTKKRAFPLSDFSKGKQRLAQFSPAADQVAFVRSNNIFIVNLTSREEIQVTKDGADNLIINGATDWVYEEEFSFDNGMYWSPKGDRLAYYRFDESRVKQFQMAMYGELYPDQYTFKYPKAGENNSKVSIHIFDTKAERVLTVNTGDDEDIYFPRIKWSSSNDQLCIMLMNRHQNELDFLIADMAVTDPFQVATRSIYQEKSETYIDVNDNLIFLKDGSGFLWNSERDGYNHIYHYNMAGKLIRQVTQGAWDVIEFYGFDQQKSTLYFSSAQESALEEHVYAVGLKKGKPVKLTSKKGTNSAAFSSSFNYFINYHSDANTPYYISLHDHKGKEVRVLKDNAKLKSTLASYNLSDKTFFSFTNSGGTELNCWMIKPADFDPSKKYPVFVNIYGGPGSNMVKDAFGSVNYLFHQMLAQQGYIVVSCDPRGTMNRGRDFKHATYLQLGKLETEDFIDLAKYLQSQSYIDGDRLGIMGWSYGGYMSSLCMTKGADYFKMGIAVAPVTNWRYYDSIYTERFMRTPAENPTGYDDNSPINHVEKLKGKYFLIHGSADDNVHYQNTMEMINAMVKANKQFDLFIYPDRNHGIYGGNTRLHLFTMINDYIKANL